MRVLAITSDAALEVALSSLPGAWQIINARDPEQALQAACHAQVALIALGTTERGLQAVEALVRLRVGLPCLVIGESAAPLEVSTPVLVRPFAMSDLTEALRAAAQRPVKVSASESDPTDAAEEVTPQEDLAIEEPVIVAEEPAIVAEEPAIVAEEPAQVQRVVAQEPLPVAVKVEPVVVFEEPPRLLLAQDRLGALLAQSNVPTTPPPQQPVASTPDDWAASLLHEIGQTPQETAAAASVPTRVLPAGVAPQAEATAARIVRHAAATPAGSGWVADGAGSGKGGGTVSGGLHRLRRRRRGVAVAIGSRASMMRRVRSALEGAQDLETLLDEIPALADPRALAAGLVREAVDLLGAETCVLYAAGRKAYEPFAGHALTSAEASRSVPKDQTLLCDVAARLEAVLVAPVDLVRGLVVGVAGTSAEALMIAPLEVDGVCHGLLLAGRSSFTEDDLERFWLLAEEAAPGFAAARLIDRLRAPAPSLAALG